MSLDDAQVQHWNEHNDHADDAEPRPTGEVQRYRVHVLITATGFSAPESFRTDVYATDHEDARDRAVIWARLQPLVNMTIQVIGTERVDFPGAQTGVAPLVDGLRETMEQLLWGARD